MDARQNNLTYQIKIYADVIQYQDKINTITQEKTTSKVGEMVEKTLICNMPLMVRSKRCSLNVDKSITKNECRFDPGGYFIIKGNEKVLINQDRRIDNKPIILTKKIGGVQLLVAEISSKTNDPSNISQIITLVMKNNGAITLNIPILNEVNVGAIFKVMGLTTDEDIVNYIVYDINDKDMVDCVIKSLTLCINEAGNKINTREEALAYLLLKTKVPKKISDKNMDSNIKLEKQKQHLLTLLQTNLFPHIKGDKIYYLGYVINKLLKVYLGRRPEDERDSYINKRIDLPGQLMFDLFKQQFKKALGECKKYFDSRNKSFETPINVISVYKPSIIEQGFKSSFSIGYWLRKSGVAQVLPRLTYLQTICTLRRIDTHIGDTKTNKSTTPRQVHPSYCGFLDPLETPEHANVGLTKHFTLITNVTIMLYNQYVFLREYLMEYAIRVNTIPIKLIKDPEYVLLFLNGELLGITNEFIKIRTEINNMKRTKQLNNKYVSVVLDHIDGELRIYCDGGRMYRPVLRVEDNVCKLDIKHINSISLNKINTTSKMNKITTLDEFEMKYDDVIEYIDTELQPYILISDTLANIELMRKRLENKVEKKDETNIILNRYDESFVLKYNYCEIHPALLLGEIVCGLPFLNHDYGVRGTLHYAQGKQTTGISSTNYADRLDITSILYNPQRPLVSTRTSKYTNAMELPAGENCIIAIACYTGYNQEDSIVFNRDSVERGKFWAGLYKKYEIEALKNQNTGNNDIFIKPDPTLVIPKAVSYNKLNDEGYCPEETTLERNDAIFGKITPIMDVGESTKKFRDTSEIYKSTSKGVVTKNYIGGIDENGNQIRKALIRSERIPKVGDKYCCYDDQTEVLTDKGWIFFKDLTKEYKVASLIDGDTLEYQTPLEIQEYEHDGEMYKIKSNQVDLVVTLNHRMYLSVDREKIKKYYIEEAKNILNKKIYYKKNIENYKCNITSKYIEGNYFVLPEYNDLPKKYLNLEAFVEFYGIWIAEGCMQLNWAVLISTHKQRVKDKLKEVCEKMGLKIFIHKDQVNDNIGNKWCFNDKQLVQYFAPLSVGAINKTLDDWVWCLPKHLCQKLINGLCLGDGHKFKNTITRRYDTSSIQLANDIQRLCLHAEYSANLYLKYKAGHTKIIKSGYHKDCVITSNVDSYRLTIIEKQNNPIVNKYKTNIQDKIINYTGKVYCCTVNGEGIIYVRRNGIPIWCCNSRHGWQIGLKAFKLQKVLTLINW